MSELLVRAARTDDAERIAGFNRAMARETEALDLDPERLRRGVAAVFADPGLGSYHVAEDAGRVVGCLLLTTEWSDWRDGLFWWIQSVYVEPEARGRGVFRALYADVLERARATDGVCGVRLYVERENDRARAVYERLGMHATSYRLYEIDFAIERGGGA